MALITTAADDTAVGDAIKAVIGGVAGIGKTSLLKTLDPATTLLVDAESGRLAVKDWPGDRLIVSRRALDAGMHPWDFAKMLACLVVGPSAAAVVDTDDYSAKHYEVAGQILGPASQFAKYRTIFIDSITEFSRHAQSWSKNQPRAFSEKTGKPDTRGMYGLLGDEVVAWANHWKHVPDKHLFLTCLMNQVTDDVGRTSWAFQLNGGRTIRELPGIVDLVITMATVDFGEAGKHRAFVTQQQNQWGYPAKDRSGVLDPIEQPHLGNLIAKITAGLASGHGPALVHALPAGAAPAPIAA